MATPIALPTVPDDLRACALQPAYAIPKSRVALTQEQVETLLIRLRKSELDHTTCGKRLLAFYEDVYAGFTTGNKSSVRQKLHKLTARH